jgi:hypothetical protein
MAGDGTRFGPELLSEGSVRPFGCAVEHRGRAASSGVLGRTPAPEDGSEEKPKATKAEHLAQMSILQQDFRTARTQA